MGLRELAIVTALATGIVSLADLGQAHDHLTVEDSEPCHSPLTDPRGPSPESVIDHKPLNQVTFLDLYTATNLESWSPCADPDTAFPAPGQGRLNLPACGWIESGTEELLYEITRNRHLGYYNPARGEMRLCQETRRLKGCIECHAGHQFAEGDVCP
jgi:hypothetical protein